MESREQGYEDDRFQSDVSRNLHCAICLNVFKDPVMCQRNQHCFCRPCIERHLKNSRTCPTCIEELTVETLNQAPRILTDCLSELNIHCEYFNRGCREYVQLGDLETHVKNCDFRPVVCSNQGCLVEINKREQTYHETEVCEFRKVKCHDCGELRRDMDEMKINMATLTKQLHEIEINQTGMSEEIGEIKMNLKEMRDEVKNQTAVNEEVKMNLLEIKDQLATLTHQMVYNIQVEKEKVLSKNQQAGTNPKATDFNVVIGGGYNFWHGQLNSVEKFCWSSKSWSPLQPMKQHRQAASSFVYKNQIVVIGGLTGNCCSDTMERMYIDPYMSSEPWFDFPAKLPLKVSEHSSVVYDDRLVVIGGCNINRYYSGIHEVLLVPPYTSKFLTILAEIRCCCCSQLFDDKIFICGGRKSAYFRDSVDSVIMYDISKNKCKQMAPLPYAVFEMATVSWGDNIIVIGGADKERKALNTVVLYNVKTEKSHMLPPMKYKRRGCVAVVVGNTIVVMGGMDEKGSNLRSVESFSLDSYSWEDLPPMNEARFEPTAVAW